MSAAVTARRHGLTVTVVDEQLAPGGQIWRSIESAARHDDILGPSYVEGRPVAAAFRASGTEYLTNAQLWQIEPGFRALVSQDKKARAIDAKVVILATGAQERPVPFPGWTLPGVMTVGAAQILLKNASEIPAGPVWIAGCGPLVLLYTLQLLRAGGEVAGFLDTTRPGQWRSALRHTPGALRAWRDLVKGVGWTAQLRSSRAPVITGVTEIEAIGNGKLELLRYRTANGREATVEAGMLLVHEGVVPNIHTALSLKCEVAWNEAQDSFAPIVDEWGETSQPGVFVAGDGAGIGGAKAAQLRGKLAAHRVAVRLGRASEEAVAAASRDERRQLRRELAIRPFLDALYKPRFQVFAPSDDTVICRCEEITAGRIRALAKVGQPGPSQVKTASRIGMGPCQGRQCGYTVTRILGEAQGRPPGDVGYFSIRPPLKPVSIGEIASLELPAKT